MSGRDPRRLSKRRHPRYVLDTEIRVLAGLRSEPVRSRTLDISESGIAGIFNMGWDLGSSAILQFSIPPSDDILQIDAIVRSRAGPRYGFEFTELTNDSRMAIQNACRLLSRSH
jgi:c-di-GMP-binding flagellar brake protein YcgR